MRCDVCLFGDSDLSWHNVRSIRRVLPRRAQVIVIDTRLPLVGTGATARARSPGWQARLRQAVGQMRLRWWQWRTGITIQTRYGCRLMSCEELVRPAGEVQLVIDYRSQVDPDQPRALLADHLIWASGFGRMMPSR